MDQQLAHWTILGELVSSLATTMVIYFPYLLTNVTYNDVIVFLGHVCEKHNNPADFFLDVIYANESSVVKGTCNLVKYFK